MLAGIHFDGERLYIFFKRMKCVLETWPKLRAWKLWNGKWIKFRPDLDIINTIVEYHGDTRDKKNCTFLIDEKYYDNYRKCPLTIERVDDSQFPFMPGAPLEVTASRWIQDHYDEITGHVQAFIETIPENIRLAASQICWNQWKLLKWARDYEGFVDLLRTNPALALGLCFASKLRPIGKTNKQMYQQLLLKKRRVIASFLGFPDQEVSANILSKVSPDCLRIHEIDNLKTIMASDSGLKLLSHVKVITQSVLYYLSFREPEVLDMLTSGFLNQIATEFPFGHELVRTDLSDDAVCNRFYDIARMLFDVLRYDGPKKIYSIEDLLQKHDRVIRKANELVLKKSIDLPKSSLIDSDTIQHIKTSKELAEEGIYMNHCVASYVGDIISERYYVYRVLSPERATLSLKKRRGKWLVDQIKCKNDETASKATIERVNKWLNNQSQKTEIK